MNREKVTVETTYQACWGSALQHPENHDNRFRPIDRKLTVKPMIAIDITVV